jgi:hypothetical protein
LKSSVATKAPQFKVTKADSPYFHIQWIESSDIASLTDVSSLSSLDVSLTLTALTTLNGAIGTYTDGPYYFNPVIGGFTADGTGLSTDLALDYKSANKDAVHDTNSVSNAFNGSAGKARLYYADTDSSHIY